MTWEDFRLDRHRLHEGRDGRRHVCTVCRASFEHWRQATDHTCANKREAKRWRIATARAMRNNDATQRQRRLNARKRALAREASGQ